MGFLTFVDIYNYKFQPKLKFQSFGLVKLCQIQEQIVTLRTEAITAVQWPPVMFITLELPRYLCFVNDGSNYRATLGCVSGRVPKLNVPKLKQ